MTGFLALIEKRPFGTYGWARPARLRLLVFGVLVGVISITVLLLVLRLVSNFRFGNIGENPSSLIGYGLFYAMMFALVALCEESQTRGYALINLSQAISFWPASMVLASIFAYSHTFNPGENTIGLTSVFAYGILAAYSFRKFGSLWFALGFHAAWDFSQSYIYGVPDSGTNLPGAMLRPYLGGPSWLTGGKDGPEGSVFIYPILILISVIIWFAAKRMQPLVNISLDVAFEPEVLAETSEIVS